MSATIRINLQLQRADNPRLYDELASLPKGPRRVSRLRTLAYAGLLTQGATLAPATMASPVPMDDAGAAEAVDQLFGHSM